MTTPQQTSAQANATLPAELDVLIVGDSIVFEEVHPGLKLTFRYRWTSSDRFGFVRTATLVNDGDQVVGIPFVGDHPQRF